MNLELEILKGAFFRQEHLYILLEYHESIFNNDLYRRVFNIFRDCTDENIPIDLPTIHTRLSDQQVKPDIISQFIIELTKGYSPINVRSHIETLIKSHIKDEVRDMSHDLFNAIQKNEITFDNMVDSVTDLYERLQAKDQDRGTSIEELNETPFDDIFQKTDFIRTRVDELDDTLIGFFKGQLIVIASRPGLGKSTLGLQILFNAPLDYKPLLFSLEMQKKKIYARMLSHFANVESWKIEYKKADHEEMRRIIEAKEKIKHKNSIILYDNLYDFHQINNIIKRSSCGIACIDYLQLMGGVTAASRDERIGIMTQRLKRTAREQEIPLILLSQLNRQIEFHDREPTLADLRESGAIEQDADVVIFLWLDKKAKQWYFIISKNRDGKIGKIPTHFEKRYYQYGNMFRPPLKNYQE
jgi:replicative DNA helicase